MAERSNEQGSPPEPPGRKPGGLAHRNRPLSEHRKDARVPVEARRDDVRRDREGDGPATTRGEHCDAGAAPPEVGRQAGPQEGREGPSRPFVSSERAVVRDPRAHRSRRAGEDRPDRGEPQEAQELRVTFRAGSRGDIPGGRRVRTPASEATKTASAIPRNRPCPTTPGMPMIWTAIFAGDRRERKRTSTMWLPLSVRN